MAELYIFDQDDNFKSIITEETGLVDTWFKDYQNHIPDEPFIFNVDSNSELLEHIKEENQVAFYDRDGDLRLVRIKELYEVSTKDGHNIRVKCEPSFLELYDHFIEDKRITNGTAQTALNRALEGSRYVGEVTVKLGNATDNFYWIDGIAAVFSILNTWGGTLKDTITLDDNNEIVERKLWIVQRLGTDNGLIVEPDYNAETISRNTLSYVETALWGQGASLETEEGGHTRYITFEDVVWSKANGDPVDKPKGQKWVGDPDALESYGYLHKGIRQHRYGHFSNQDYEDPEELLRATWNELQERKLKEIIHEAVIYESDKKVSIGDTATILNREYNKPIELQSQITGLEYDILLPNDEIKIVVGKYIDMNEDPLQKEVDDLKQEVSRPRPTKPIDNNSYPDITPGTPIDITATGAFQTIQLFWDYDSNVYISHYEVYGSQISDFVPDEQHLLYRGRVSAFSHEVETDEKWYYYVRAVNTRGTVGEFSNRVSASSIRVLSDDILFGSIIADHLSNNLDIADKLAENTIDSINKGPMEAIEYTQQEIEDTESRLLSQLNSEIGDVNGSIANLNTIATDLQTRANTTEDLLNQHDGKFTSIETEVNKIDGRLSASITNVERIDDTVNSHSVELTAQADLINAKLDSLTYQTDKAGIINSIEANETEISVLADGLELRVTKEEFDNLEIGGTNLLPNTSKELVSYSKTAWDWNGQSLSLEDFEKLGIGVGDELTLRVYIDNPTLDARAFIQFSTTTPSYRQNYGNYIRKGESGWSTLTIKIVQADLNNLNSVSFAVRSSPSGSGTVKLSMKKLEKGNKATDWSPAPEDALERITKTETTLIAHAGLISAKAEKSEVYTRTNVDTLLGHKVSTVVYNNKMTTLDLSIDGISGRVSNTETNINDLTGDVSSALSQIGELDVRADGIELNVSEVRADLDGLEIGGRNLLPNTSQDLVSYSKSSLDWNGQSFTLDDLERLGIGVGDELTLKIYIDNPSIDARAFIQFTSTAPSYRQNYGNYVRKGESGWSTLTIKIVQADLNNLNRVSFAVRSNPSGSGTVRLSMKKLEKGNKATDWSPAPEDTDARITTLNASITTLAGEVELKASQTSVNSLTGRMSNAESSITTNANNIKLKVDEDGVIASINVSKEGVRIAGNKHHITGQTLIDDAVIGTAAIANLAVTNGKIARLAVNTAQIADAAIASAKIAKLAVDDSHIANLSVNKLLAGEIDTSKIKIRGGSANDYALIDGSFMELRGRYKRTWQNSTTTNDVKTRLQHGHLRFRNDSLNRSLYMSEFGISTYVDGEGESGGSSGTLLWWDETYTPGGSRGITLHSHPGAVALASNTSHIVLDSFRSVDIYSRDSIVYISPKTDVYSGNNNFWFNLIDGTSDGFLMFGSRESRPGVGLRLSKSSNVNTISVVDDNYTRGGNTTFDVGKLLVNDITKRSSSTSVYWNGTSGGNTSVNVNPDGLRASGIRVLSGDSDMFLATNSGAVRITSSTGYNQGGTITYRPIHASAFNESSSREYKTDISTYKGNALDVVNNLTVVNFRLKDDIENGVDDLKIGFIAEDSEPVASIDRKAIQSYKVGAYNTKAIQEIDLKFTNKIVHIEDKVNKHELEIQYLKQKIKQLESAA